MGESLSHAPNLEDEDHREVPGCSVDRSRQWAMRPACPARAGSSLHRPALACWPAAGGPRRRWRSWRRRAASTSRSSARMVQRANSRAASLPRVKPLQTNLQRDGTAWTCARQAPAIRSRPQTSAENARVLAPPRDQFRIAICMPERSIENIRPICRPWIFRRTPRAFCSSATPRLRPTRRRRSRPCTYLRCRWAASGCTPRQ
jgi:hypothetical protein